MPIRGDVRDGAAKSLQLALAPHPRTPGGGRFDRASGAGYRAIGTMTGAEHAVADNIQGTPE